MTVGEYVKTRDLSKTLKIMCNGKVVYDSKHNTLEKYLKIVDREVLNVHIGKTLIGLNVREGFDEE